MAEIKPVQKLRLGSAAPNFEADSTNGPISLYDYLGDGWGLFICIPDDFTPVATTELVMFAHLQEQFATRNVKILAMTTNNRPSSNSDEDYVPHKQWVSDMDDISEKINPIQFPLVTDADGTLSRLYNVLDDKDVQNLNADNDVATGLAFKSRTIFIIGPLIKDKHHIRLIFNYPAAVGFNTAEVLRAVDALQTADSAGIRTPANWVPGGDIVVHPQMSDEEANEKFPNLIPVKPYLRLAELPAGKVSVQNLFFRKGRLETFGMKVENGEMKLTKEAAVLDIQTMD